eukprot:scaffold44993_cov72-Phaeocystis_antarctica.AAC.1
MALTCAPLPLLSPCSSRRVAHSSMPASAAVKGVVRPERRPPPPPLRCAQLAAQRRSPAVCHAWRACLGTGAPQQPCAAAVVPRLGAEAPRMTKPRPRRYPPSASSVPTTTCYLLLATYCRLPTPHRQGPRQHQLPRGGGGRRLGRLPRARYGRAVRRAGERASSRRWEVGGGGWW